MHCYLIAPRLDISESFDAEGDLQKVERKSWRLEIRRCLCASRIFTYAAG